MGRVFQPTYTKSDGAGGRITVKVKDWYCEWTDAAGEQRNRKIGTKSAATAALAKFEEEAARKRHGLPDLAGEAVAHNRPIEELFAEYLDELEGRDTADEYRNNVRRHLRGISTACHWQTWADVTDGPVIKFLNRLRAGNKNQKSRSPATVNGYVRSSKGFAEWYADKLEVRNPLRGVRLFNEEVDRRRSRRVLDDDEFARFIAATEACPPRHNALFTGPQRAALYRVAAYTGLRLSELASLTPDHFRLDDEIPVVAPLAKDTKGKRFEPIPLEASLLAFLRGWLAGKVRSHPLWPGTWAKQRRHVKWVERDAARAELGPGVIFHSLRRKFVTDLFKSGADIDEVRRLARHKSVQTTLNHYAESKLSHLAKAVSRLKPLA